MFYTEGKLINAKHPWKESMNRQVPAENSQSGIQVSDGKGERGKALGYFASLRRNEP